MNIFDIKKLKKIFRKITKRFGNLDQLCRFAHMVSLSRTPYTLVFLRNFDNFLSSHKIKCLKIR